MFFILSKLLFFLLMPATWIIILLIWRYISKSPRRKRRLNIAIITILLLCTNKWLYDQASLCWQPEPQKIETVVPHETAILLTGMINFDKYDQGFFGYSSDRFIQTNRLYHLGKVKKILITGGSGSIFRQAPSESLFLQRMFIESGIPAADIIVEPAARNTYENGTFTKKLIDSLQLKGPFLLVTSAQHMPRSEAVFKKAGITFNSFATDFQVYRGGFAFDEHVIPNPGTIPKWTSLLKEIVGLWVYKLTGKA